MYKICLALLLAFVLVACSQDKQYVNVGPNWAALHNAKPSKDSFPVELKAADHAKLGDNLALSIHSWRDGYLWLVQVDPNDTLSVLYPNQLSDDNRIAADQWQSIPRKGQNWNIEAMKPTGDCILMAIVTTTPGDINTVLDALKNPQGSTEKSLRVVSGDAAWGMAKHIITIEE